MGVERCARVLMQRTPCVKAVYYIQAVLQIVRPGSAQLYYIYDRRASCRTDNRGDQDSMVDAPLLRAHAKAPFWLFQ